MTCRRCYAACSRWRVAKIEQRQIGAARRTGTLLRRRLGRRIDRLHASDCCGSLGLLALRMEAGPHNLKLLERLIPSIEFRELIREHQANVVLPGAKVSKFF